MRAGRGAGVDRLPAVLTGDLASLPSGCKAAFDEHQDEGSKPEGGDGQQGEDDQGDRSHPGPEVLHPADEPLEAQGVILVRLGQRTEDRPTDLGGQVHARPDRQGGEAVDQTGLVDDLLGGGPFRGVEDAQVGQHRHAGLEVVVDLVEDGGGLGEPFGDQFECRQDAQDDQAGVRGEPGRDIPEVRDEAGVGQPGDVGAEPQQQGGDEGRQEGP